MNLLANLINRLAALFKRLGVCATVGFIAGILTGFALVFYNLNGGSTVLTAAEVWKVTLLLWAAISVFLLLYLYILCRYTLASIFFPTLFNSLITCFLTIWFTNQYGLWTTAIFIGIVIGLLIGKLLCILCKLLNRKIYGLH